MSYKSIWDKAVNGLLVDKSRQSFLVCVLSALSAVITTVACVTHFVKDSDKTFAYISLAVVILSLAVFFLTIFLNKYAAAWRRFFMGAVVLFFGYLCYDGGPDGFLHVWIL